MVLKKSLADFYFGPMVDQKVASVHVRRKRRNLFITLTDLTGAVLGSVSAKTLVADRKKRMADHIIESLIKRILVFLKAYRIEYVRLFCKSIRSSKSTKSRLLRSVFRSLRSSGINLTFFVDLVPVAHNGCRKKKIRRV